MKRLLLIAALTCFTVPAHAQWWEEPKPKPAPRPVERKAPPPKKEAPPIETARPEVHDQEGLYVALFTPTDRLFWTGRISGKVTFYGMARDRLEFQAECDKGQTPPCARWTMKELGTARPQTGTNYISFMYDGRLIVWPHTFLLSTSPFSFASKSIVEKP